METEHEGDIFDDPRLVEARRRVMAAIAEAPDHQLRILKCKLDGMRQCGTHPVAWVTMNDQMVRVIRNQCRARGCPVCESLRAGKIRGKLRGLVKERAQLGRRFAMYTLTIRHKASDSLRDLYRVLKTATGKFLRATAFQDHTSGWCRSIEIPWGEENGFHPHVHVVVESIYWDKAKAKALGRSASFAPAARCRD